MRRTFGQLLLAGFVLTSSAVLVQGAPGEALRLPPRKQIDATASDAQSAGARTNSSGGTTWKTTGGALLFVVALVVVCGKVLKKSLPAAQAPLPNEVVQILGRKPLDHRHTLHVVRCGSRLLLLGASGEGLRALAEVTNPEEVEHLSELCESHAPSPVSETFGQLIGRFRGNPQALAARSQIEPEEESAPPGNSTAEDEAARRLKQRFDAPPLRFSSNAGDSDRGEIAA